MNLVVFGTYAFQWMLIPFAYLLEKYAPGFTIEYFCDRQVMDLPSNVQFRNVPGLQGDWDWREDFGGSFKAVLSGLKDDIVFICLPDMWPSGPPDLDGLNAVQEYMVQNPDILRTFVGNDPNLPPLRRDGASFQGYKIVRVHASDQRVGAYGGFYLGPSLWQRVKTVELTERMNIWDFEIWHKTKLLPARNLYGAWVEPHVWTYGHVMSHDYPNRIVLSHQFVGSDVQTIMGLVPKDVEVYP